MDDARRDVKEPTEVLPPELMPDIAEPMAAKMADLKAEIEMREFLVRHTAAFALNLKHPDYWICRRDKKGRETFSLTGSGCIAVASHFKLIQVGESEYEWTDEEDQHGKYRQVSCHIRARGLNCEFDEIGSCTDRHGFAVGTWAHKKRQSASGTVSQNLPKTAHTNALGRWAKKAYGIPSFDAAALAKAGVDVEAIRAKKMIQYGGEEEQEASPEPRGQEPMPETKKASPSSDLLAFRKMVGLRVLQECQGDKAQAIAWLREFTNGQAESTRDLTAEDCDAITRFLDERDAVGEKQEELI